MRILYLGSSSICLELENETPYTNQQSYLVYCNGQEIFRRDTNVFSLFDLRPDTDYSVTLAFPEGENGNKTIDSIDFRTMSETCCVNVLEFGAVGDGVTDCTSSIQAAIQLSPEGARVRFPAGIYMTGPLCLRSHITLELTEGAVLRGSPDRMVYPILPGTVSNPVSGEEVPLCGFEGREQSCYQSLLHGSYARDIAIIGPGTVDGNAQNSDWWTDFSSFPAARPRLCFLNRCENAVLHGVSWTNSPSWNLHPYFSRNISILDCTVTAPKVSPNTDAVDPDSCDGVNIIGCRFSVGDDCIAIKAGKLEIAQKYHRGADHHVIRNCRMENGHGAVTMGSEASAGIRNVSVTQCLFLATDRGLRIKTRRGRGKDNEISNVLFDNIRMDRVLTPIVINMWYNCCDPDRLSEYVWSRKILPVDDRTPHLGSFVFRNMECTGTQVAACYIDGLTESPVDAVTFDHILISFDPKACPGVPAMRNFAEPMCRAGLYLDNVTTVICENVILQGQNGPELIVGDVNTIRKDGKIIHEKS